MKIGTKLKEVMKSKRINQKELSELSGLSQSELSRFQNNKKSPTVNSLIKIADGLECSTDLLLNRDETNEQLPSGVRQLRSALA